VLALILAVPLAFGIAVFLTEIAPDWMRRPVGIAVELLAAVPSIIYGMWGFFVIVPIMSQFVEPTLIDAFDGIPVLEDLFAGPPFGTGILTAALVLTVMVVPFIAATMRDVFETVGGDAIDRHSLYPRIGGWRHHAWVRPSAGRDDGGDVCYWEFGSYQCEPVLLGQYHRIDRCPGIP
jgi:hypothetical protein